MTCCCTRSCCCPRQVILGCSCLLLRHAGRSPDMHPAMLVSLHTLSADAHRLQCARTATWSVFSWNSAAMRLACSSSSWAVEPCRFWLTPTVASAGTHLAFWAPAASKTLLVACCTHQVSMLKESLFRLVCEVCTHDVRSVNAAAERPLLCHS